MKKKGQFYLIAAVFIILAVSALAGVATYAIIKPAPVNLDSLSNDLQSESPRVIDYGIYESKDINTLLDNFTQNEFAPYFLTKADSANVFFVYGDKDNLYAIEYNTTSTGTISSTIGNGAMNWESRTTFADKWKITVNSGDNFVNVTAFNKTYEFNITQGKMFYFLMIQDKDNERYIKRN